MNPRGGARIDDNGGLDTRKMDSPELHPLPPLTASARQAEEDDEDEEFYSPKGSLGGSVSGTGSGSRRAFAAVGKISDSSSNSYSSSTSESGSPARSHSISLSPPVSWSPKPKSREENQSQSQSQSHNQASASALNEPALNAERALGSSPTRISNASDRVRYSPTLPALSLEVGLGLKEQNPDAASSYSSSPTLSNASEPKRQSFSPRDADPVAESPIISMASSCSSSPLSNASNPKRQSFSQREPEPVAESPIISNASSSSSSPRLSVLKLQSLSPQQQSEKGSVGRYSQKEASSIAGSPTMSNASSSYSSSPRLSIGSQPKKQSLSQRDADPVVESATISSASSCSSSPARYLEQNTVGLSNVWDSNAQSVKVHAPPPRPPPPPPPPPPSQPQYRNWAAPKPLTPISKPPPTLLIPPSRPFVLQTPPTTKTITEVSPIELPPASSTIENNEETPKPKLKPLHWDKVRASSDRETVWDQLRSSSFKLNEEMIETLFVVNAPNQKPKETTPRWAAPSPNQEDRVLDPKKSQNIAISLRALNVTMEEVCDALLEGNADTLGTELLESLLKMAPTKEEERKLKEYKDDSPIKLGPAEKFLKAVLDVPFAFKRVDAMLYISNFDSEVEYLKKSFETLEVACEELRNSRMFLKLLEAVLKTGNRMNVGTNRGDAHAFKLDTLLKLADVKAADGKTTLLHFVVQEIIRTEGARLSGTNQTPNSTLNEDAKYRKLGLQVVSSLSSELTNVKKAAAMDSDVLCSEVAKLSSELGNIREVVKLNETVGLDESTQKFSESMNRFMKMAEEEIIRIRAQESVALSLVKEITEYFHGNSAREEAHPFRIFMVVRDFLMVLDRVCKEVSLINERTIVSSAHKFPVPVNPMMPQVLPVPVNPMMPQVLPGFPIRRPYSSSDDETASP